MTDILRMFTLVRLNGTDARRSTSGRPGFVLSSIFLCFIALSLVLPLVKTLFPLFPAIVPPLEERRTASPFPSFGLLLGTDGGFAAELNKWFDDRMGFRDLFIRTKNQIDYSVFRTSNKVYVGRDGWLFYRGFSHPVEHLDASQLSALEQSYVTFAERLRERGVRLIVVGYPDKSAIYPEMTPPEMALRPAGGNYDRFRDFLADRTEFTYIDAEKILKQEKLSSSEQLFSKGDMHVNQVAQIPIVKEIVAQIARLEGRPDIHWNENFKIAHARGGANGSEARFLSLLFPRTEELPYLLGSYTIGGHEPDGQWLIPDPGVFDHADAGIGRPFDWQFTSLPQLCPQRLPGMVLFGNSFSDTYWTDGLHRYFCSIRRAREPLSRLKLFVETMPADTKYFIYEYYEPWLTDNFEALSEIPSAN